MQLTDESLRAIADKACASPVSVMRRLLGLRVRGRAGERIDRLLEAMAMTGTKPKRAKR